MSVHLTEGAEAQNIIQNKNKNKQQNSTSISNNNYESDVDLQDNPEHVLGEKDGGKGHIAEELDADLMRLVRKNILSSFKIRKPREDITKRNNSI